MINTPYKATPQIHHPSASQRGFTLLEVLIALMVVSIALVAAARATSLASQSAVALEQRNVALMSATNRLMELRLLRLLPATGLTTVDCPQGAWPLRCEQQVRLSQDANFRIVTIRAFLPSGPTLAEVSGLVSRLP